MAKISDSRIIRYFLPSTANSLPEYLPYMTLSPSLTVIGSSFFAGPYRNDYRKPHTQVKPTACGFCSLTSTEFRASLAGDGPLHQLLRPQPLPRYSPERTTWRYDFRSDR